MMFVQRTAEGERDYEISAIYNIPLLEVLYWRFSHVVNRKDYSKHLIHDISRRLNPAYSRLGALHCVICYIVEQGL